LISDQAKGAIDRIFNDAVRSYLPVDSADTLVLTQAGRDAPGSTHGQELMVVTSSSFAFRMLTMFRLASAAECVTYYARGRADVSLAEAFSEVANLCCGAMNRQLSQHFPHLGMSTPYVLNSQCLDFIGDLHPQHVARLAVAINDKVRVHATLCVCSSAPLDFAAHAPLIDEAACSGELELL
jgi:hypothetical protein